MRAPFSEVLYFAPDDSKTYGNNTHCCSDKGGVLAKGRAGKHENA